MRDESAPEGLMDARRRMGPGDGYADDDVSGHGMPEIPGAGDGFADGFAAGPRLPRRDGLADDSENDVEGHRFAARTVGEPVDDEAKPAAADEATPA